MNSKRLALVCALSIISGTPRWASAHSQDTLSIRPRDLTAVSLVRVGYERSATFRALMEALQESNVIVYVDVRHDPQFMAGGSLQFVGESHGIRWVRATVDSGTARTGAAQAMVIELTAILAHELQHAREVAETPAIRNAGDFDRYFRTVGLPVRKDAVDTAAARIAGRTVEREIRGQVAEPAATAQTRGASAMRAPADVPVQGGGAW